MNNKINPITEQMIKLAGEAGAKAALDAIAHKTSSLQSVTVVDAYKATERRLRALIVLRDKVEYDKERLKETVKGQCAIGAKMSSALVSLALESVH